jgi:hypothetical protein
MRKMFNEGNQIHNFISSSGSGTVINYGSGSDFLTSYGSGSTSQKVTVPTVPVPGSTTLAANTQCNAVIVYAFILCNIASHLVIFLVVYASAFVCM